MIHIRKYLILIIGLVLTSLSAQQKTKEQIDSMFYLNIADYTIDENIENFTHIYNESEKINYEKGIFRSLTTIGELYLTNGQYQKAIEQFDKIGTLTPADDTYAYKIRALQNKAFAYQYLGFYEDAFRVLDESDELTKHIKGDLFYLSKGRTMDYRATLSQFMKKPTDTALYYLRNAVVWHKKIENERLREVSLNGTYVKMGNNFIGQNKIDSVFYYTNKTLSSKHMNAQTGLSLFKLIGHAHDKNNDLDSAAYYYKKSLDIAEKLGHIEGQKELHELLASISEKQNDKESYIVYNKKYKEINDSITATNKISINKASSSIKNEISKQTEKTKKNLYLIIAGVFFALCVIAFLAFIFFKNYNKERKEKELKQEKIAEKDQELKIVKLKVNESFDEITQLAKTNDTTFLTRFKEVYPEFSEKLKEIYPELNSDDLRFCALLKLNFSTKDIAEYTFVTVRSVQTRKSRLRKRLQIPSEDDLYLWMDKLN